MTGTEAAIFLLEVKVMENERKVHESGKDVHRSNPLGRSTESEYLMIQRVREENETLRVLIAELIIKNQVLRFEALMHSPGDTASTNGASRS